MNDRLVLLFTKPSRAGVVKTRLIDPLSAEQAAELHAALLADLLARLEGGSFELRIAWALETSEQLPDLPWAGVRQTGEDLGERLYRGLSEAVEDSTCVAAIGSDHPELRSLDLELAFETLEAGKADVVIGPAEDGGYYLIALRSEALKKRLFEKMPWSTADVLQETLERCASLGFSVRLLRRCADVDTPADLERLAGDLASGRVESPLTAKLLRTMGWLRTGSTVGKGIE